jgi:hypothetical protein
MFCYKRNRRFFGSFFIATDEGIIAFKRVVEGGVIFVGFSFFFLETPFFESSFLSFESLMTFFLALMPFFFSAAALSENSCTIKQKSIDK